MNSDRTEFALDEPRTRIGVIAPPGRDLRGALLDSTAGPKLRPGQERMLAALERVFPVTFERPDTGELDRVDGMLVLGSTAGTSCCPDARGW